MRWTSRQYLEVIVRLLPRATSGGGGSDERRVYDALVYCAEPLTIVHAPDNTSRISSALMSCRELPLVGDERIRIRWSRYQEYIASFIDREKGAYLMRDRLMETLSPGLAALLKLRPEGGRGLRIWWSCDSPEMEDLPWELAAYGNELAPGKEIVFVRCLPPAKPPLLSATPPSLRVGVIYQSGTTPAAVRQWLDGPQPNGVSLLKYDGVPVRAALARAIADGVDAVHLVADAYLTLSYDGILYFHGESDPELPAAELGHALAGTRVTVVGLSAAEAANPDMTTIGGALKPAVYRGFACVARWRGLAQTVVAPLGPIADTHLASFWTGFYRGLASSNGDWRAAITNALSNARTVPAAIFLRHPFGHLFTRNQPAATEAFDPARTTIRVSPMEIQADLSVSVDAMSQLRKLQSGLDAPLPSLAKFLDQEERRQAQLRMQLDPWEKLSEREELQ